MCLAIILLGTSDRLIGNTWEIQVWTHSLKGLAYCWLAHYQHDTRHAIPAAHVPSLPTVGPDRFATKFAHAGEQCSACNAPISEDNPGSWCLTNSHFSGLLWFPLSFNMFYKYWHVSGSSTDTYFNILGHNFLVLLVCVAVVAAYNLHCYWWDRKYFFLPVK